MNDVGLARTRVWIQVSIVLMAAVTLTIGLIVRARDAPLAPTEPVAVPTAVSKVTSLEGLSLHPEEPLFSLDVVSINGKPLPAAAINQRPVRPTGPVSLNSKLLPAATVNQIPVRPTDDVSVSGWAADRIAGVPANGIFVAVGSGKPVALQYGGARPDVAKALGNPKLEKTGFAGKLPSQVLPSGTQPVRFFVVDGSGNSYGEVPSPISLTVK